MPCSVQAGDVWVVWVGETHPLAPRGNIRLNTAKIPVVINRQEMRRHITNGVAQGVNDM